MMHLYKMDSVRMALNTDVSAAGFYFHTFTICIFYDTYSHTVHMLNRSITKLPILLNRTLLWKNKIINHNQISSLKRISYNI